MSDPSAQPAAQTSLPASQVEVEVQQAPAEPVDVEGYKALKAEEAGEAAIRTITVRDRDFRIVNSLPGIILLDLGLASDPNATQGEQLRAIRQFLHAAIHEDDVELFEVYLRTARPVIEMEELNKVVEKLITEVAGRPTD